MKKLRILLACEESQAVTKAFRKLGHEAFSCDLLPCSGGHPEWHFQENMFDVIKREKDFDLMIAFPPCTDLAVSGARHFERKITDGSQQKSIEFFMSVVNIDIKHIAIENPIGIMSSIYKKPDQIIHPYHFGDKASKSTCLWLKNLPILKHTNVVEKGEFKEWVDKKTGKNKRQALWYYEALQKSKTPEERRTLRSKFFQGIADAMATQWSEYLLKNQLKKHLY
jgi:site-specific DNA-cytosine methylase